MSDVLQPPDPSELRGLAEPAFDANSMRVLKERYFAKRPDGSLETPKEFLWRVASSIALPERPYAERLGRDPNAVVSGVSHAFYDMMARRDFLPNTPCLVNAGRPLSMLSACFVLPVPDSIEGIFYNLQAMALIQKAGGGTGYAFSELRANGAPVISTGKEASGPVSFMKVFNAATDSIKQGGVRRGANMGVLRVDHPDVFAFMRCKKELDAENRALYNRMSDSGHYSDAQLALLKQELLQTQMNNFNISIGVTDAFMAAVKDDTDFELIDPRTKTVVRTVPAREIWEGLVEGAWQNGEPGVLFLDHPNWNPLPGLGPIHATNPCVTGDTVVAVADGRGHVRIDELAAAGRDVPVYSLNERGGIVVRTMRRPRRTGEEVEVFKLTLDDGSVIRATGDHTFYLREAPHQVRAMRDLKPGDSLKVMTRFEAPMELSRDEQPGSKDFWWLNNGHAASRLEHRYTAGFANNEDLRSAALDLTRSLGRRFGAGEWETFARERGLPQQLSGWRRNHLNGGVLGLAKWAALQLGFAESDADPRVVRHLYEALEQGYDAEIVCGLVLVNKRCEVCDVEFHVTYANREIAYCSTDCNVRRLNGDPVIHARSRAARGRKLTGAVREKQLEVFTSLKATRGRVFEKDWVEACKSSGISPEIARPSSPFRSFAELQEAGSMFNHRVVSVEFDSYQDVYNGTVDEFHNFFVGGFESKTANGKRKYSYLCNENCGEQALHGYDSCNLGSINVGHFYDSSRGDVDWERLGQTVALASRFLDNVIDANVYPLDEIEEMVSNNRRIGLGIMGFADLLIELEIAYGSPASIEFAAKLMRFIKERAEETSELLARERGEFPNKHLSIWRDDPRPRRNAALLSIAPTGTISMIAGCSFGCEPYFGMAYTKHVMKDSEGRPQHLYYVVPLFEEIAKDEGFYSEELLGEIEENRGSVKGLAKVPEKWQRVFTVAADVSVNEHIDMLAAFQLDTCNAVSKTVNAPNDDTRENVAKAIFRAYKSGCKGFTYYRDGSRTEQVVTFSKDSDIKGGNRDTAAGAAPAEAPATTQRSAIRSDAELDLEALLARANALLEGR